MRGVRIAGCALVLAALCGAQQGRGGRGRGGRGAAAAASSEEDVTAVVQELYRDAKASLPGLPGAQAATQMAAIAGEEMRLFPAQGLEDYGAAFDQALALAPPEGTGGAGTANAATTDAAGQAREAAKEQVELAAVTALASRGEADQALALARLADVPKAPLYDALIEFAGARPREEGGRGNAGRGNAGQGNAGRGNAGRGPRGRPDPPPSRASRDAANQQMVAAIFNLVQECKQSGGAFPYRGAAVAMRRAQFDPLSRMTLVRDAYQWAGNETDPARMNAAFVLLEAGHRLVPELDGELENAVAAMLRALGESSAAGPFGSGGGSGDRLLGLLGQLDPPRAAALAAQWPSLGSGLPTSPSPPLLLQASGRGINTGRFSVQIGFQSPDGGAAAQTMTFSTTVTAPAPTDATETSGASEFMALLAQAESLQRRQPSQALSLANKAEGLLDESLWASQTTEIARLATLYAQLGASADSARVMAHCLDEADAAANSADSGVLNGADASQQAPAVEAVRSMVLEVYSVAARLDLDNTAQRAEDAQFALLKPAVLARIALVAQVGIRPVFTVR